MSLEKYLHGSDMDGTLTTGVPDLIPANNEALAALGDAIDARRAAAPEFGEFYFGFVSGRNPQDIEQGEREQLARGVALPRADFKIGAVGEYAAVFDPEPSLFVPIPGWPRPESTEFWSKARITELMDRSPEMQFGLVVEQEQDKQGNFKQSYYVQPEFVANLGEEGLANYRTYIADLLTDAGITAIVILSSVQGEDRRYLDIMAPGIDKGTAFSAIGDYLGVPHKNRSSSGDSNNDKQLAEASAKTIVVANAEQTYRIWAKTTLGNRAVFPEGQVARGVHQGLVTLGRLATLLG